MITGESDLSEVLALIDDAAICAAELAATLTKISAVLRSSRSVKTIEHSLHQRPQRVKLTP